MRDRMPVPQKADLLYVRPTPGNRGRAQIVPMGVISLMNALPYRKAGRFETDLTTEEIKYAKIVAMDLHWFFSLARITELARQFKEINPSIKIIVGGYTASVLGRELVKSSLVDYVIRGDAEKPFPMLVETLLEGGNINSIPNLWGKEIATPLSYRLTQADYDKIDMIHLSWFPAFQKTVLHYQKSRYPSLIYPWVPAMRGCLYDCDFCYGNPKFQRAIANRGIALRSPEAVQRDLAYWSKHPHIQTVHMIGDFIDAYGRKYASRVFSQRYDLDLYFEFYNLPEEDIVEQMLNSFRFCHFWFSAERNHADKSGRTNFAYLARLLDQLRHRNCRAYLFADDTLGHNIAHYFESVLAIQKRFRLPMLNTRQWILDIPRVYNDPILRQKEYEKFFLLSRTTSLKHRAKKKLVLWLQRWQKTNEMMLQAHTFFLMLDLHRAKRKQLKLSSPSPSTPLINP